MEETKEYKEGWNANNKGKLILANPYTNDHIKYKEWKTGWLQCQNVWNNPNRCIPLNK